MKTVKAFSFCILLSAFLFSCSSAEKEQTPPDFIDQKHMTLIVKDLTLSEAILNNEPMAVFNDTLKRINVLKEHNVSEKQFLSSFKYYTEHPKKLKAVYDSVLVMIDKTKLDTIKPH